VPGRKERAGAHRNDGSTVRRRKWRRAAAFVGGEGAPLGGDGGCGVLQHRRSKGGGGGNCKKLQGLIAQGGAQRGVADDGGARPESARESGLPVAGGGGPGAGSGWEARALERGARAGSVSREWTSGRGRALSGSVGGAA
jgi:hypothetical protein